MINKSLNTVALGLIMGLGVISTNVSAAPQGHLKVTSKVQKLVVTNRNGKKVATYVPAAKVLPGETVQYNTFFQNIGNQAANNITIVNPIPKHTTYLPNTAQGQNTVVSFSVNGGKSYAPKGALKVRGRDGKVRAAKPSDYTHVKWQYRGNLAPKATKSVGFKVRLK
jgi:uncharacterized repeat protein (TIGR01451 family)